MIHYCSQQEYLVFIKCSQLSYELVAIKRGVALTAYLFTSTYNQRKICTKRNPSFCPGCRPRFEAVEAPIKTKSTEPLNRTAR